ncbi:hypothetical protein ABZY31_28945 [Streptomyces sp. NPDC006529]
MISRRGSPHIKDVGKLRDVVEQTFACLKKAPPVHDAAHDCPTS